MEKRALLGIRMCSFFRPQFENTNGYRQPHRQTDQQTLIPVILARDFFYILMYVLFFVFYKGSAKYVVNFDLTISPDDITAGNLPTDLRQGLCQLQFNPYKSPLYPSDSCDVPQQWDIVVRRLC